ncbi:hypothetical protein [Microbacterium sp. 77mftsu3.1]|uniref:hypothetical protein n=1 Tax=Microbacterium sp. 77mftsu3.1 TaxID=1761802 RepID=UPI00115FC382|nr:hypothetical protein [Microbacterium sp. 77mftsu3.1]
MSDISTIATARREDAREKTTGRFGAHANTIPEAALLTVDDLNAREDLRERGEDAVSVARQERQFYGEVLSGVEDAANMYATRRGQFNDRDDIVGDTIVDILAQQKRGTKHINDGAFKQFTTRAVSSRYIDKDAHHTTLKGRRIFNERSEELMQELGRPLNPVERKALADEIRLSFAPGNRPSVGFETKNVPISLDLPVGEIGDTTLGDLLAADESGSSYATATSKAAAANDALEEGGSFKAADARKNIWNILADGNAPVVAIGSLSDDRAHRAAVEEFGGPAAVALAWQNAETAEDDPVNDALFAPFGNLSDKDREDVTSLLLRNPDYAAKVWDSAMTAAVDVQKFRALKRREARATARNSDAA